MEPNDNRFTLVPLMMRFLLNPLDKVQLSLITASLCTGPRIKNKLVVYLRSFYFVRILHFPVAWASVESAAVIYPRLLVRCYIMPSHFATLATATSPKTALRWQLNLFEPLTSNSTLTGKNRGLQIHSNLIPSKFSFNL